MLAYYVHDLDPLIFHIYDNVGPRWYGLGYVLAFLAAYLVYRILVRRGYADLSMARVGDFITGCALFGVIIGGRLGYVLLYKPEMLREPLSILRVWEGGMSSHGGMLGLLAFTFYYAWRHKISWTNLGDNLVVTAPIGSIVARDVQSAGLSWRPQRFSERGGDVSDPLIEPLWTGLRVLATIDGDAVTLRDIDGDEMTELG